MKVEVTVFWYKWALIVNKVSGLMNCVIEISILTTHIVNLQISRNMTLSKSIVLPAVECKKY